MGAARGEELHGAALEGAAAARAELWGPVREQVREEIGEQVRREVAAELETAAEQVRADEGALTPAAAEPAGETVNGDGESDSEGEPAEGVLEPAGMVCESDDGPRPRRAMKMGTGRGVPRGGSLSLAERLARGGE